MTRRTALRARPAGTDQQRRIAVVAAGILLVALMLVPRAGVAVLVAGAAFASGWEYRALTAPLGSRLGRVASGLLALACAALCVASVGAWPRLAGPVIAAALLLLAPQLAWPPRGSSVRWIAGPLYFGALPAFLALLRQGEHGAAWVGVTLAVAWGGSIGAYVVGRTLGRTPLAPHVSPAKTVEGAIGGLVVGTTLALLVAPASGGALPWTTLLWAAPLAQAASQVGDLAESRLKRLHAAKDSGTLLGAEGGMLDVVDGLCLASPLVWLASGLAGG
jgi:phosphatidate cytidylyltransferase